MFALKLSSVILSESTQFSSLCFDKGANEVGESGSCFYITIVLSFLVLLTTTFWVSCLFVMTTLLLNCYFVSDSNCKRLSKYFLLLFLYEKCKPTFNHRQYSGLLHCLGPFLPRPSTTRAQLLSSLAPQLPTKEPVPCVPWSMTLPFVWMGVFMFSIQYFLETDCQASTLYND